MPVVRIVDFIEEIMADFKHEIVNEASSESKTSQGPFKMTAGKFSYSNPIKCKLFSF